MLGDSRYYKIDRDAFLAIKPLSSRLSSAFLDYDYTPKEQFYKVAVEFLTKQFYDLFGFVSGENTPHLVVQPDEYASFCRLSENHIQLGTAPLGDDKFSQQQRVDSMVAVMLHEMFHKRFTVRDIIDDYYPEYDDYQTFYYSKTSSQKIQALIKDELFRSIFNILEDHRIEKLGMDEFPGYVFYFDSLREYALTIHSKKKINEDMLSGIVIEYLMFKVLMPELRSTFIQLVDDFYDLPTTKPHKFSKKKIKDAMLLIDDYVDTHEHLVYSNSLKDVFQATEDIYNLIPQDIKRDALNKMKEESKEYSSYFEETFHEVDNGISSDYMDMIGELMKIFDKCCNEGEKLIAIPGDGEGKIEPFEIISVHAKAYQNVTIYSPKVNKIDNFLLNKAKRMSMDIARNLGFLASRLNQLNQNFELTEGDIDEDEIYAISYSKNIFYEEESKPGFEFDYGILVDESGSMAGDKIKNAILACLSQVLAVKDSKHVNMFVYGHSQGRKKRDNGVELYEYYNSKKRITNWKNLFAISAGGGNADGYAIAKMGEIMLRDSKAKKKIMVVISDGQPSAAGYGGEKGEKHVREIVEMLEKKGIEVIQICIDNIDRSPFMFKHYIPFDDMGTFMKEFKNIIQKKLVRFSDNV